MRTDIEDLIIDRAIMHILDVKRRPVYSELPLDTPEKVYNLLKKHIVTSIKDENSRVAKFINLPNSLQLNCQTMLDYDDDKFVNASIEASQLFYANMIHSRAAQAYCILCKYHVGNVKYVALLKLDFAENYSSKVQTIEGKQKTFIELIGHGIPSANQKLQKCFFYKTYSEENDYDIILLDKQASHYRDNDEIADYFMNFIRCELKRTSTDCTRRFRATTEKFINEYYSDEYEKKIDLQETLYSILKSDTNIDITAFAEGAFGHDEKLKKDYLDRISTDIGDFKFIVDKDWVSKHVRRRKIMTDNGIELKIDEKLYHDASKFEIKPHDEESDKVDLVIKGVKYKDSFIK